MISKEEIFESRRKAARELDLFINTYGKEVEDSEGVSREVIWNKAGNVATLAFGDKGKTTRVDPNPYDADLFLFQGNVRIDYDDGTVVSIKRGNRHLFIPKFTGFTVFSTADNTAVLTFLDANIE